MKLDNLFLGLDNKPIDVVHYFSFEEYFGRSKESMSLGKTILVDVLGREEKFVLEAFNKKGEMVFKSNRIIRDGNMREIHEILSEIENSMDKSLLEGISECEHLSGEVVDLNGETNGRKIWIPSIYNVMSEYSGDGKDDVCFEEFEDYDHRRMRDRCGLPSFYLLDTRAPNRTTSFCGVGTDGVVAHDWGNTLDWAAGICICFSI